MQYKGLSLSFSGLLVSLQRSCVRARISSRCCILIGLLVGLRAAVCSDDGSPLVLRILLNLLLCGWRRGSSTGDRRSDGRTQSCRGSGSSSIGLVSPSVGVRGGGLRSRRSACQRWLACQPCPRCRPGLSRCPLRCRVRDCAWGTLRHCRVGQALQWEQCTE